MNATLVTEVHRSEVIYMIPQLFQTATQEERTIAFSAAPPYVIGILAEMNCTEVELNDVTPPAEIAAEAGFGGI